MYLHKEAGVWACAPTATASSASSFDETLTLPPPADVFFAASGAEDGMFRPSQRRARVVKFSVILVYNSF